MNGQKINGLNNPVDGSEPVTKNYGDTHYLQKSGGTMTGNINMDGNHISGIPSPTEDSDIITKGYMETYITNTFLGGAW